jgi:hypothetical protein
LRHAAAIFGFRRLVLFIQSKSPRDKKKIVCGGKVERQDEKPKSGRKKKIQKIQKSSEATK